MKKIMSDKSFWLILVISIISLVLLTVGVIFLTRENAKEFYSAGYIINSTATKSDKYYFNNNTVYKENVFNEYVFKDVDDNEVSSNKDNFIHYLDNSLSFMKNGVILDLDNFNENIVPYYNITDKSIVQYNNGGYYVETADKTLVFGNFLGRITDNKYIVVGNDISVKLAGNDDAVSGDYFEILFIENGIVKVENQEGSYQTVSDGTIIYISDDIRISLGDKTVVYGDEVKLTLSELTIDGNENIDIEPSDGLVKEENDTTGGGSGTGTGDGSGTGTGDGSGTGTGDGSGTGTGDGSGTGTGDGSGTGTGDGSGTGTGDGSGTGTGDGSGTGDTTTVLRKEVSVNLIEASSDVNSITAKFQVIDTADAIKGNLVLTLVNTTTGRTVYTKLLANVVDEQSVIINSLSSDCNYVMTIVDEYNENSVQYFQKSFRTDSLDLRLKREMVTENSLTYSLDFGSNSDIVSADITLYDEEGNEIGSRTIENGTDEKITFEGLTNNTLYDVVVDNVFIKNVGYGDYYTSRTSDITLKIKPVLGDISVKTNDDVKTFTLSMDDVDDVDNSIVRYTYQIFKAEDITEDTMFTANPVYSFSRSELDDEILKLDEAKNLFGNKDYRFKIVAQYFDNYRYNEIETRYSDYFQVVGKPTITFVPSEIDINRIAGTVIIDDTDCTIPFEGRECSDAPNDFVIRYYGGTSSTRNVVEDVVVDPENLSLSFDITGLQENTLYTFEVYADVDLKNGEGLQTSGYIGGFNVSTSGIKALMMQNWEKNTHSFENPISVNTEMVSTSPDDDSIDKLASIRFNLYSGDVSKSIDFATPIASYTVSENIKEEFYNKQFLINSSMFEYTDLETSELFKVSNLNILKQISGGRLSRYYTIEVTDAYDETGTNEFVILNNVYVYQTPAILLLEDEVTAPEIVVEEITNIQTKSDEYLEEYEVSYIPELNDEIVRGYKVTAVFDKQKIENYFTGSNPITKINFYVSGVGNALIDTKTINFFEREEYTTYFFLGDGTDYGTVDTDLRRGNTYNFSYDLVIDEDGNMETDDLIFPAKKPISEDIIAVKQEPSFKLYIDNSSASSITYKYRVFDYDNALNMDEEGNYYIYYTVNDDEEVYKSIYVKDGSSDTFTLSNLVNSSIYSINYYRTVDKKIEPSLINIGSYFFDGFYNGNDYNIGYKLEYGNFDNRLKIVIPHNEFLNRVSAYLLTLTSGEDIYQTVISNLSSCSNVIDEEIENPDKCIILDYKDIASFKGKNITVSLEAFYDTGYVGFGQTSILGSYFENLNLVDNKNASKTGFVYQTIGNIDAGKYFYVNAGNYSSLFDTPKGVLGFELVSTDNFNSLWKLNTSNLVSDIDKKFVPFGTISNNNSSVITTQGSISIVNEKITINPKVLDKMSIQTDNDSFKFTSITPKVSASVKGLINGATMNINLSIDPNTLASDFVATDGKYKFYIDIYEKEECPVLEDAMECNPELILVKTVDTDYDSLSEVTFQGLNPNTKYYYKISADMNKNGTKVKTPLFDYNRAGYVEFQSEFNTLDKDKVFNRVAYGYTSSITEETYSKRLLNFTAYLRTNINFNLKYQLYDIDGNLEFESIIPNEEIVVNGNLITAKYAYDVTGNDFVFGPGYHNLVITAVTTDLQRELELYNDKLIYSDVVGMNFRELSNPTFNLSQSTAIDEVGNEYDYNITYTVTVTDVDKVINNGIYHIELQNSAYDNACNGNPENCKATVNIKDRTCSFDNGVTTGCTIKSMTNDSMVIDITFNKLLADTNYVIYVSAETYRNNLSLTEKEGLVYVRKSQYTKSPLNFSLGAVTPTAVSRSNLVITFAGAANLTNSLVGIDYNITVQGGERVTSGSLGITDTTNTQLKFGLDADGYPTITIPIPNDKQLGLNNYIIITYYYKDSDGNIVKLKIGEDTSYQYTVKNQS